MMKRNARAVGNLALNAFVWFGIFALGGFALIVAAVFVLAGFGWALLAAGCALLVFAGFVMRGLANG